MTGIKVLLYQLGLAMACASSTAMAGGLIKNIELHGLADLRWSYVDGEDSWLNRGVASSRFDPDNNHKPLLADVGLAVDIDFSLQSKLSIQGHYYANQTPGAELTEAYWQYRPLNQGNRRSRYRLGLFYPSISLENKGLLWSSPYAANYSGINSWLAEELRLVGVEGSWTWRLGSQQQNKLNLKASIFGYNDPTGAVLAWKGWSNHDRQTGLGGELPLSTAPGLAATAHRQAEKFEPFVEVDGRPGFYLSAKWTESKQAKVEIAYYDNQAEDTAFKHGQYAWRTRFYHIGAHRHLAPGIELFGQYIHGSTTMGRGFVNNSFESLYISLAKRWGRHRAYLRLERAVVRDNDQTPMDPNDDAGNGFSASYSYRLAEHWKAMAEVNIRRSKQKRRAYKNFKRQLSERQLMLGVRYFF